MNKTPANLNNVIKNISTYIWFGSAMLFVSYIYFIGSITFSIVKQKDIQNDIKVLVSSIGKQELVYLQNQRKLTEQYAQTLGLKQAEVLTFTTPKKALAWNVGY